MRGLIHGLPFFAKGYSLGSRDGFCLFLWVSAWTKEVRLFGFDWLSGKFGTLENDWFEDGSVDEGGMEVEEAEDECGVVWRSFYYPGAGGRIWRFRVAY